MTFSLRFTVTLLVLSLVGIGGRLIPELLVVSVVAAVILCGLALLDFWLVPGRSSLIVRRVMPRRLIVGKWSHVGLEVENHSRTDINVILHDEPPDAFQMRDIRFDTPIGAMRTYRSEYDVRPVSRGDYNFQKITVVVQGPFLGLVRQQHVYDRTETVKVYPDFKRAREFDLFAMRHRLYEFGVRSSRQPGVGTEFESLREYTPDDDYRRINWAATARSVRPISMQFEIEKSQQVLSIIDCGRLMGTEARGMTRLDHAVNAAILLSHVAVRKGDRAGLLIFSDRIKAFVQPGKSTAHLGRLLESAYHVQSELIESDYAAAFEYLQTKHKRRSLIVVFTEIVDGSASHILVRNLIQASKSHLVLCVLMKDPWIQDALHGPVRTHRDAVRKAVTTELVVAREKAIGDLAAFGIQIVDVLPDEFTVEVLNKYLEIKNKALL